MLNWEDPRCFNEGEGQIGEQCSFRGHVKGVARGHLLSFLSHKAQFFFAHANHFRPCPVVVLKDDAKMRNNNKDPYNSLPNKGMITKT